jgi:hypothetical protein
MGFYSDLFESLSYCCDHIGFRHGLVYTVVMFALGLGFGLSLLTLVNLLWMFGVLHNPYRNEGSLQPRHYVYALVCIGFIANTVFARIQFSADRISMGQGPELRTPQVAVSKLSLVRTPGAAYVLGSALLFLVTLTLDLVIHR